VPSLIILVEQLLRFDNGRGLTRSGLRHLLNSHILTSASMDRLSFSHSRRASAASASMLEMFPALESRLSSKARQSEGSKSFRDSVIELQNSHISHLAEENIRRKSLLTDQELYLYKLTEKINTSYPDSLRNPCLLSEIAWNFREKVPKSKKFKNEIEYLECFTGTVAVVSIFFKRKVYRLLKFVKFTNKK
jgi:hypothetical protein